uniref:Uncharacterized protein n=1 Tax=Tanacetum cinerariifolium TaxID=118510 RepID=A0A699J8Z3_TANCI|nr:hypothetical protein [Tanacetum cinerariifolium]
MATASSTGLVHTARTRRPQPKGNTRNARVPSASKSGKVKKIVTVEDHHRTLLLSKSQKTMSSKCNNIKLAIWNDKSEILCDTYKQCLVTANHDACLTPSVNVLNSRANKLCANVPCSANQKRHRTQASDHKDNTQNTSANTKFAKQPIGENFPKVGKTNALSKPVTLNSVSSPQEPIDMNNDKPHVITKKDVNSNLNGLSSTGVDNTKTRRPQPRSNTKNDMVPSASKGSRSKNKEAKVKEHHRNLLLSKNNKHISLACNNS